MESSNDAGSGGRRSDLRPRSLAQLRLTTFWTLAAFHGLVERVTVGNLDERSPAREARELGSSESSRCFLGGWSSKRSADSTSSDMVQHCRAASCFSRAMTPSSVFLQPLCLDLLESHPAHSRRTVALLRESVRLPRHIRSRDVVRDSG